MGGITRRRGGDGSGAGLGVNEERNILLGAHKGSSREKIKIV